MPSHVWLLEAFGRVAVEFDRVAFRIVDPGLPCMVAPQLGVCGFDATCADLFHGSAQIVYFETDVPVGRVGRPAFLASFEKFDEGSVADLEIEPVSVPIFIFEVKGFVETEDVDVEILHGIEVVNR